MLDLLHVNKTLNGKLIIDDCSFTVKPNTVFGIVGINGVGKTTLMRLCSGILKADSGTILLGTETIYGNIYAKKDIVFISDSPFFEPGSTIKSILNFYESFYKVDVNYFNYLIDISNSLTPTSVIRLDNFFNFDDYIVINGELIVKDNYQYYIIKEDRHTEYLKDVYSIEYYDNNEVIYQDYDGNYKNVGAEDFVNQKFSKAFDSISTTFTNDTHISYNVDFSNDIVYLNDDSVADIKYLNYAKEGFIVKENQENKTFSVKLFNNPTVYEYDSDKIVGINKFTSTDNSTLYQVQYELSNHDYSQYFVLERSEN